MDTQRAEEMILKALRDIKQTAGICSWFFGLCFGRYDGILEIQAESSKDATNWIDRLQTELWENTNTSLSVVPCYSLHTGVPKRTPEGECDQPRKATFPIRTYSFFRLKHLYLGEVFAAISKEKRRARKEIECNLLWNPSTYSFVLKLQAKTYQDTCKFLYNLREKRFFLQDFCTFVTLRSGATDPPGQTIRAWVNIKLCHEGLAQNLKSTYHAIPRLGYFDLVKEVQKNSLREILDEIVNLREQIKSIMPNRTATVLALDFA